MSNFGIANLAAVLSVGCYAVAIACLIGLEAPLDMRTRLGGAVSDHANGPRPGLFLGYALAGMGGAAGLALAEAASGLFPFWAWASLAAMAVLRIGIVAFRTGDGSETRAAESRLHLVFAVLTFALAYRAVSAGTPAARAIFGANAGSLLAALDWVATAALFGVVACLLIAPLRRWFGLAERAFLFSTLLWFALVALCLTTI
ncbi:hypothetical protein [Paracoccus pacificus]|uniref:DUF998 domain-containing protein n=1 Tax=Paracoccus pacificus TaxID=1463598 RepID=A0ABW4R4F6_9RHOB